MRGLDNPSLSVVFVHGFLSSKDCWKNENSGTYWPDLLKNQPGFESLGIYVYTYQTDFFSGSYNLGDVVDDLKEHLELDHVIDCKRLIFVCHSMGGIVVRRFLVARAQDLLDRKTIVGLYLVASPSLGSEYANWLNPIAKFMGHTQAEVLRFSQNNQWLNDLNKDFKNLKEGGRLEIHGKELLEDKFIALKKFVFMKQVVEPFSGALYFADPYKVPGTDHFSIAKPENDESPQHRLLVKFINDKFLKDSSLTWSIKAISTPSNSISTDAANLQPWQQKLMKKLIEQLEHKELDEIVTKFINALNQDYPNLGKDTKQIAYHLVAGMGDRHKQVAQFLTAVNSCSPSKSIEPAIEEFLSYLLQTLVRKYCEANDQGLTSVPVNQKQTAELIGASRTSARYLPTYSKEQEDFTNGQSKAFGYFHPETGELDEMAACKHIAKDLLKSMGHPDRSDPKDPMALLVDYLRAYSDAPENAPIQALYLEGNSVKYNPLHVNSVADQFRRQLNNLIWVYVYGGDKASDWLHTSEGGLEGLIQRYETKKQGSRSSQHQSKEESTMSQKFSVGNIGDHATVSIVTGTQTDSHVGHNNYPIDQQYIEQLQQLLTQALQDARKAEDIGEQRFNEIA